MKPRCSFKVNVIWFSAFSFSMRPVSSIGGKKPKKTKQTLNALAFPHRLPSFFLFHHFFLFAWVFFPTGTCSSFRPLSRKVVKRPFSSTFIESSRCCVIDRFYRVLRRKSNQTVIISCSEVNTQKPETIRKNGRKRQKTSSSNEEWNNKVGVIR